MRRALRFGGRKQMPERKRPIDPTYGWRLKQMRELRGISQSQLADAAGLTHASVSQMENGQHRIYIDIAHKFAPILGCSVADITGETQPQLDGRLIVPQTVPKTQPPGSPMPRFFFHSATQLQAAVDLMGLGRYSWNPQTNVLTWDARLKAIWGLPPGIEPDYEIWYNGIHRNDVNRVDAAVARCKDPRQDGLYDVKYRVLGLDGVERWVHTRGRTYFENDQPIDFAGVLLDITPRRGCLNLVDGALFEGFMP
jgi:transcriptional regulator with XRE-family HTH domain